MPLDDAGKSLADARPGNAFGSQAQLIQGAPKEVVIEYYGDFKGIDLSPVTTALITWINL